LLKIKAFNSLQSNPSWAPSCKKAREKARKPFTIPNFCETRTKKVKIFSIFSKPH